MGIKYFKRIMFLLYMILAGFQSFAQSIEVINSDQLLEIIHENSPKTKVINFWATWCKPCVEEIPNFERLHLSDEADVILISLDFVEDLDTRVYNFVSKHELSSRIYLLNNVDYNSWISRVDKEWTGAIPATLVINTVSGKRKFIEKPLNEKDLYIILNEINN